MIAQQEIIVPKKVYYYDSDGFNLNPRCEKTFKNYVGELVMAHKKNLISKPKCVELLGRLTWNFHLYLSQ